MNLMGIFPLSRNRVSFGVLVCAENTFLSSISSTLSRSAISLLVRLYQDYELDTIVERDREFLGRFTASK